MPRGVLRIAVLGILIALSNLCYYLWLRMFFNSMETKSALLPSPPSWLLLLGSAY